MPLDRARFEEFHIKIIAHVKAIREVAMEMDVPFMFLASVAVGSIDKDDDGRDMAEHLFCENNHEDLMEDGVQKGVMIELMLSMLKDPKLAEELMKIQIVNNLEPMARRALNDEEWR
jgi:hypothetical protein